MDSEKNDASLPFHHVPNTSSTPSNYPSNPPNRLQNPYRPPLHSHPSPYHQKHPPPPHVYMPLEEPLDYSGMIYNSSHIPNITPHHPPHLYHLSVPPHNISHASNHWPRNIPPPFMDRGGKNMGIPHMMRNPMYTWMDGGTTMNTHLPHQLTHSAHLNTTSPPNLPQSYQNYFPYNNRQKNENLATSTKEEVLHPSTEDDYYSHSIKENLIRSNSVDKNYSPSTKDITFLSNTKIQSTEDNISLPQIISSSPSSKSPSSTPPTTPISKATPNSSSDIILSNSNELYKSSKSNLSFRNFSTSTAPSTTRNVFSHKTLKDSSVSSESSNHFSVPNLSNSTSPNSKITTYPSGYQSQFYSQHHPPPHPLNTHQSSLPLYHLQPHIFNPYDMIRGNFPGEIPITRAPSTHTPPPHFTSTSIHPTSNQANLSNSQQPENNSPTLKSNSVFDINEKGRERLHNDYNQHFIDTGERPQNFVRDAEDTKRFEEYPKLERLMQLKKEVVQKRSTPAQYMKVDLKNFDLTSLGIQFDVILVDPPWPEYYDRVLGGFSSSEDLTPWSLEDISSLKVEQVAETPSFCFLWCGVTHLEEARYVLNKWGFRRCEDICWLKTNKRHSENRKRFERDGSGSNGWKQLKTSSFIHDENSILHRIKEHCLVGIRGTVRRSQDTHFIHANLDTDIILDEEPVELGSTEKPKELYDLIERFCLGRRRLELFGTDNNIRSGWVTLGKSVSFNNFDSSVYSSWFQGDLAWPETQDFQGGRYTGTTTEIEMLRPKSPPRSNKPDETPTYD